MPVTARNGSDSASDFLVHLVGKVGQRDAQRPVGRIEAAAVQQHDPVVLGQAEGEIKRMNVLLQVFDGFFSYVFARPKLKINQAIVSVVVRVRAELQS